MQSASSTQISGVLVLLLTIALFAGTVVLQVYLSRRESRWPGLILPILSFILALTAALALMLSTTAGSGTLTVEAYRPDGTVTTQTTPVEPELGAGRSVGEALIGAGIVFLVCNIPTVIYTAIYCGEREKFRRREQMKRMNIQDLE